MGRKINIVEWFRRRSIGERSRLSRKPYDFAGTPEDGAILDEGTARTGAVIMGRRLFDVVDAPHGWNETIGYGADCNARPPVFVLTHQPP